MNIQHYIVKSNTVIRTGDGCVAYRCKDNEQANIQAGQMNVKANGRPRPLRPEDYKSHIELYG